LGFVKKRPIIVQWFRALKWATYLLSVKPVQRHVPT